MENQNSLEELKDLLEGIFQIPRRFEQISYSDVQEEYKKVKRILEIEFYNRVELVVINKLLSEDFSVSGFINIHELIHKLVDGVVNERNIGISPFKEIGKFTGMCCLLHAQKCVKTEGGW